MLNLSFLTVVNYQTTWRYLPIEFHMIIIFNTKFNTYVTIPWNSVLLEKLIVAHLVHKLPTFYGSRRFTLVFTRVQHQILFRRN
jgi:hypothetical protein